MNVIEKEMEHLQAVLDEIPPQHRGILFERVFSAFHPQENTHRLELAFAQVWAKRNDENEFDSILPSLLYPNGNDSEVPHLPQTEHEWRIACRVAATLVQWLPTSVGCAFLREAFERGGGKFTYELPKIDEPDCVRR